MQLPGTFLVVDAKQTDGSGTIALATEQAVIPTQLLQQFVGVTRRCPQRSTAARRPGSSPARAQTIYVRRRTGRRHRPHVELTVQDTAGNVTVSAVT